MSAPRRRRRRARIRRRRGPGVPPGDEVARRQRAACRATSSSGGSLADEADVELDVGRGGLELDARGRQARRRAARRRGASRRVFDQVRTCDNHCEFCFIYQLPPGMRRSLYLKDDDYRLSLPLRELHDAHPLHRGRPRAGRHRAPVAAERQHPRHRPRRARRACCATGAAATSLRWLRALLDHGIEVHGQVVVCPGVNDGDVLDDTLAGVLDQYPELASLCVVPLGVSRFNTEPAMRPHTAGRGRGRGRRRRGLAGRVPATCSAAGWCSPPTSTTCWPAGRSRPPSTYEGFPMHEDGDRHGPHVRARVRRARRRRRPACRPASSPGSTARRPNPAAVHRPARCGDHAAAPARRCALRAAARRAGRRPHRRVRRARCSARWSTRSAATTCGSSRSRNEFFGGNTGGHRPDGRRRPRPRAGRRAGRPPLPAARRVPVRRGRFLDGTTVADLPRPVEVVATDGIVAAPRALERRHDR